MPACTSPRARNAAWSAAKSRMLNFQTVGLCLFESDIGVDLLAVGKVIGKRCKHLCRSKMADALRIRPAPLACLRFRPPSSIPTSPARCAPALYNLPSSGYTHSLPFHPFRRRFGASLAGIGVRPSFAGDGRAHRATAVPLAAIAVVSPREECPCVVVSRERGCPNDALTVLA